MPTPAIARLTLQEARPLVRRALSDHRFITESVKGCNPSFFPSPVPLSPPLNPGLLQDEWSSLSRGTAGLDSRPGHRPWIWFNLAVHPDHPPRARDSESLIRQLNGAQRGWILEVAGNGHRVDVRIAVDKKDVPVLKAALLQLHTPLGVGSDGLNRFPDAVPAVAELVPRPPYIDPFTRLDELPHPPVGLIVELLSGLSEEYHGLYQVCAAPVRDDRWLDNAKVLHDVRFRSGLEPAAPDGIPTLTWTQQKPSGNISRLTQDTYIKVHPDRAYYFALCRCALWSPNHGMNGDLGVTASVNEDVAAQLKCLVAPLSLIRQAGRSMDVIPPDQIVQQLSPEKIVSMITQGRTHRHGVLVNTEELASFAHMPPLSVIELLRLDNLRCEPLIPKLPVSYGTRLGTCVDGENKTPARVKPGDRPRHTVVVGRNGVGKSTLLQSMCLDDLERGDGALIIDPHGEFVRELADRLPDKVAERTKWLDFNDPSHALLFNPLQAGGRAQPPEQIADHFIGAFKTVTEGWGDRLEHILRHLIIAAILLPNGSLLDVLMALERDKGKRVRDRMCEACTDPMIQDFLKQFSKRYKDADINPVLHKLSKLLLSGGASLSLRQSENRLDVPGWMARGDVVLVDLGSVSGEFKHLIGSFLIAAAYSAALGRRRTSQSELRPFHLYTDEAHRFSEVLLSGIIAETRKFKVGLTAAFQYLKQFNPKTVHALGTAGTCVVFNVDSGDAESLAKTFRKRVSPEQITALDDFEAYARLGIEPVHLRTPHYTDLPKGAGRFDEIRARSIQEWYVSRYRLEAQVNTLLRGGGETPSTPVAPGPEPEKRLPDDPDWPY